MEKERNLEKLLKEYWAKSDGTSIREHTDRLIENLEVLRKIYGDLIEEKIPEKYRNSFWELLKIACEYHDYGKIHSHFQKKVGNKKVKPPKDLPEVRHNLISPIFVPEDLEHKELIYLAIIHHHDYEPDEDVIEKLKKVLEKEFSANLSFKLKKLLKYDEYIILKNISKSEKEIEKLYVFLKGFLLRIDHSSSNKHSPKVEVGRIKNPENFVEKYIKEKKESQLNDLQKFVLENREENLLITASTGYGKTEAGFIFLKDKGFFTLPVRTSVNAIYLRAKEVFGEENVGLLHSTALIYMLSLGEKERNSLDGIVSDYHLSKNFGKPLIVATPDQILPFIFRFKGFEKYLSLLSYSRIVIDELQLFEPWTLGFIVKALEKIKEFGGKILVMSATFPVHVEEDLKILEFKKGVFLNDKVRHNIKIVRKSILDFSEEIKKLSQIGKVLVVTNTIKRAIELKEKIPEANLLHGHFILKDRRKKEEEITEFFESEEKGVWITTQIAEVSLDLDADFLITELSTADSLIQRMGRANRKGEKDTKEPNVFILTEDCSGIGPVYRKKIHEITQKLLKEGQISEEDKLKLVEETYRRVMREDKDYMDDYKKAKSYIDSLWNLSEKFSKEKAFKLFRDIDSVVVIPEVFRNEVEKLIQEYLNEKDIINRYKLLAQILDYTFSMQKYKLKSWERVYRLRDVFWVKGEYDEEKGFIAEKEEENII